MIDLLSHSSSSCHEAAVQKKGDTDTVISISSSSSNCVENDKATSKRVTSPRHSKNLLNGSIGNALSRRDVTLSPPAKSNNCPPPPIAHITIPRQRSNNSKNSARERKRHSKIYSHVEEASKSFWRKRPPEKLPTLIHKARIAISPNNMRNEAVFTEEFWDNTSRFSAGCCSQSKQPLPLERGSIFPESVMVTSENEQSVSSGVTLEPAISDSDIEIISISSSNECHTCERHSILLGRVERLLENVKLIPSFRQEDQFTDFITCIEALLDDFEADAKRGISIFYHECRGSGQFNAIFTTKLLKICDGLCQVCTMATKSTSRWKQVLLKLFRKSGHCGVVLRLLYMAIYELTVCRRNSLHDVDHVLAVSCGLQMIATMMTNIYSDSRACLQCTEFSSLFVDSRLLQCHRFCIKRNCRVDNRGVTSCRNCGLRFHKSCFVHEVEVSEKCCPVCKAAASLYEACTKGNLADIYSLVVERGASPFLITGCDSSFETALHAALRSNNYNLMSMLLYGTYVLLNCDSNLKEWNLPSLVWGRDSNNLTPFEKGIDICTKDMNAKPPTEILLLLRNRGVDRRLEDIRKALVTRQRMLQVLNDSVERDLLHFDLSMGVESVPLRVDKSVSMSTDFFYISRSVESRDIAIRWFDCRSGNKKSLSFFEGQCTITKLKKLHHDQCLPSSWQVFCNYLCSSMECSCQVEGLRFGLEVFRTNGRGLGLRTAKGVTIKEGEVICNYEGEIISVVEARRRDDLYAERGEIGSYTFNLDESGDVCIDATAMRSASAFINHSCAMSNTYLSRGLGPHLDERIPFLVFRAKEDICELQELTFNYIKGNPDGEKPVAYCSECSREHCLCQQCAQIEHKKQRV